MIQEFVFVYGVTVYVKMLVICEVVCRIVRLLLRKSVARCAVWIIRCMRFLIES